MAIRASAPSKHIYCCNGKVLGNGCGDLWKWVLDGGSFGSVDSVGKAA